MMLCCKHISQYSRYGKFLEETIYTKNEIIKHDDFAEIILKDKNLKENGRCLIDLEDVEKCENLKWHVKRSRNTSYVVSSKDNHKLFIHRFVLGYEGKKDVDHINHNGLDNRKSNLRIISHKNNIRNSHNEMRGIRKMKSGRYGATITIDGKSVWLGTFDTKEEAKEIRLKKEKELLEK